MANVKRKANEYVVDKQIDNWRLYNRYKLLALNMFKWENLPEGIQSKNIEKILYENGQGVFYKNKDYGTFDILDKFKIDGNEDYIKSLEEGIKLGNIKSYLDYLNFISKLYGEK